MNVPVLHVEMVEHASTASTAIAAGAHLDTADSFVKQVGPNVLIIRSAKELLYTGVKMRMGIIADALPAALCRYAAKK